jgi:hypothetical protein
VYPRRQLWTSYSPPWELEISQTTLWWSIYGCINIRVYLVRQFTFSDSLCPLL